MFQLFKKNKEKLKKDGEKYKILYETSSDAIMTLEPPIWRFTSGNPAAIKMFDCKDEKEFISLGPWQLSPEKQPDGQESTDKAKRMIMKAMEEGSNFFEWTHKRYRGKDFPATVLLSRVTEGEKTYLQATVRDISVEKKMKEELRRSEEKFKVLVESSPDCIKLFDTNGKLLYMSPGGLKEHHLKNQTDAIGWDYLSSIVKEQRPIVEKAFKEAVRGKISSLKIDHVPGKATRICCLETFTPIKNIGGKVISVFGVSRDITELKIKNEKITQFADITKKNLSHLIPVLQKVALGDLSSNIEIPVKKDEFTELLVALKRMVDDLNKSRKEVTNRTQELENARIAAQNVLEDLNTEKSRTGALVKDLGKFKLAVDNVTDNIIITDSEGIVIYANKAVEKVTGYRPEEAIGKKSGALWKTPMPVEYYQKLWDTIKKHKKVFISEIQNKRKNGEIYTALISISPIINEKDNVNFYVAIERDITKEKEIDKAKTEFVAVASHALRTPLTAIRGLVSMLLDKEYGKINKDLIPPLKDIEISSERLIHLVNDLLNISRIQAGRMGYTLSDFSIADAITETIHFLQPLSKQKGIRFEATKIDPITVQGDSEKVKEILNNLIGNSFKFTDKGSITVSTKIVGDKVYVYISDTGIGIKREDMSKLFSLFQQIQSGEGRPIGTGFGLYESRELILKMGGELWVDKSEVNKGSVFVFSIPRSNSALAIKVKREIKKENMANPYQKSINIVK